MVGVRRRRVRRMSLRTYRSRTYGLRVAKDILIRGLARTSRRLYHFGIVLFSQDYLDTFIVGLGSLDFIVGSSVGLVGRSSG
jgi:hypothetical protein